VPPVRAAHRAGPSVECRTGMPSDGGERGEVPRAWLRACATIANGGAFAFHRKRALPPMSAAASRSAVPTTLRAAAGHRRDPHQGGCGPRSAATERLARRTARPACPARSRRLALLGTCGASSSTSGR
jgi:hypothetical protein